MSRLGKENLETFLFFPCENGSPIRDKKNHGEVFFFEK